MVYITLLCMTFELLTTETSEHLNKNLTPPPEKKKKKVKAIPYSSRHLVSFNLRH